MRILFAAAAVIAALAIPAAASASSASPVPPVGHGCVYTWPGAHRCHTVG